MSGPFAVDRCRIGNIANYCYWGAMQVIDLQRLMAELIKRGEHGSLVKALQRVLFLQSCSADITQATQCLERLIALDSLPNKQDIDWVVRQSLTTNAIVSYYRATAGTGARNGRGASQIHDDLKGSLLDDHVMITNLRNKSIGHVHIGRSRTDWHTQHYLLVRRPDRWEPVCISTQHHFNRHVQDALARILPAAQEIISKRFAEASSRAADLFSAASGRLPVESAFVDAAAYFGDAARAAEILRPRPPGSITTTT